MKHFAVFYIAVLLLSITSCGGGSSPSAISPEAGSNLAQVTEVNPATPPQGLPDGGTNDYSEMEHRWIVELKDTEDANTVWQLTGNLQNAPTHYYHHVFQGFAGVLTVDEQSALAANAAVKYIERDEILELHDFTVNPPTDPWGPPEIPGDGKLEIATGEPAEHENVFVQGSNTPDWGVQRINAFPSPGAQGSGISVAIIDTGIDEDHPDLASAIVAGFDAYNNVGGISAANDTRGHGTHVAGIVGARDNSIYTSGVAPQCSLVSVKVFPDGTGGAPLSSIIRGLDWIAANQGTTTPPIRVANMSIGGSGTNYLYYDAIQSCVDLDVVFAVSAGNDSRDASGYKPARFDNVITVSAMRRDGSAPAYEYNFDDNYSNFGNCVDLIAPGSAILSSWHDGTTATLSGTSMASPHVAGAIALWLDDHPADGFPETYTALITNGESGNWGPDPDGLYEPLADCTSL